MAAGLGFKTFNTGDVLTAGDTNGYLMQGVLVFADATARDAAITVPEEGQFAYLKDTDVTTYYTGTAWANLDTTGMTNPMTTTGDVIYSSSGSTPARLGIGSTDDVLTVAGGVPTWAAPAGGGDTWTLLSTTTLSSVGSNTVTISSLTSDKLYIAVVGGTATGGNWYMQFTCGTTGVVSPNLRRTAAATFVGNDQTQSGANSIVIASGNSGTDVIVSGTIVIGCKSTSGYKFVNSMGSSDLTAANSKANINNSMISATAAITGVTLISGGGSFTAGTMYVYGA